MTNKIKFVKTIFLLLIILVSLSFVLADPDNNLQCTYCDGYDCDYDIKHCVVGCKLSTNAYSETMIFEKGVNNCCGDDAYEYLITGEDETVACCDNPEDQVKEGMCLEGFKNYDFSEYCLKGELSLELELLVDKGISVGGYPISEFCPTGLSMNVTKIKGVNLTGQILVENNIILFQTAYEQSLTNNPILYSCTDGIQNQDETGIDCGGPCVPCTNKDDNLLCPLHPNADTNIADCQESSCNKIWFLGYYESGQGNCCGDDSKEFYAYSCDRTTACCSKPGKVAKNGVCADSCDTDMGSLITGYAISFEEFTSDRAIEEDEEIPIPDYVEPPKNEPIIVDYCLIGNIDKEELMELEGLNIGIIGDIIPDKHCPTGKSIQVNKTFGMPCILTDAYWRPSKGTESLILKLESPEIKEAKPILYETLKKLDFKNNKQTDTAIDYEKLITNQKGVLLDIAEEYDSESAKKITNVYNKITINNPYYDTDKTANILRDNRQLFAALKEDIINSDNENKEQLLEKIDEIISSLDEKNNSKLFKAQVSLNKEYDEQVNTNSYSIVEEQESIILESIDEQVPVQLFVSGKNCDNIKVSFVIKKQAIGEQEKPENSFLTNIMTNNEASKEWVSEYKETSCVSKNTCLVNNERIKPLASQVGKNCKEEDCENAFPELQILRRKPLTTSSVDGVKSADSVESITVDSAIKSIDVTLKTGDEILYSVNDGIPTGYAIASSTNQLSISLETNFAETNKIISKGKTVDINYGGAKITAYLPAFDTDRNFFIASDGSTYYDEQLKSIAQKAELPQCDFSEPCNPKYYFTATVRGNKLNPDSITSIKSNVLEVKPVAHIQSMKTKPKIIIKIVEQ
ncbi:MAG: hypothetical protein ABIC91_06695 [Nanoarchaeota archaeon]|nr:hypothetical protein [Nanoarchaeota archaeon]MBU1029682.1 hypothetical protein [Nanoarchaeota archaeon]MBU1849935.1 hypothetical protein [Nanoarchaeota archaeon]